MNDLVRQKIEEGISVLSDFEPAVGEGGPTMKELEACWEDGKPFDDDASYDAMQHCWLLVREALDMENKCNNRRKGGGMLISVIGRDGLELWIEAGLIMSVRRHVDSTAVKPKCMVNMKCETASEEWLLCDDADRVRRAVDEANSATRKGEG